MSADPSGPLGGRDPRDPATFLLLRDDDEARVTAVRTALVEAHQGLAYHFAERYVNRGVERDDLRQVAAIGLAKAVDRFDPDRGVQFATFARPFIVGEIRHHFRDATWTIRVPRSVKELSGRVKRARATFLAEQGRAPRPHELASVLDVDVADVIEALDAASAYQPSSLDRTRGDGDDRPAVRSPSVVETGYAHVERRLLLEEAMAHLEDRERTIIELRFWEDRTQSEIAEVVGVSQMHVSRLIRRTLAELHERLTPAV